MEDGPVRKEMIVYYDSLKTPTERRLDDKVAAVAVQAEKQAYSQEAQLAKQGTTKVEKAAAV